MTTKIDIYEKLMKAKRMNDKIGNSVYTMLWSDIQTYTKLGEVTPKIVVDIIKRQLKQNIETRNFHLTRNHEHDAAKVAEFDVRIDKLKALLPLQLTETEVKLEVNKIYERMDSPDLGNFIKTCMNELGEYSDKAMISQVARSIIFKKK